MSDTDHSKPSDGDWAEPEATSVEDHARHDHARREINLGVGAAVLFFVVILGWAAFARLDAAVYATGQIEVAGNRQTVQNREGGTIQELDVHEGDKVRAGQVLLRLRADDLNASARATAAQVIEQKALQARLNAELTGARTINFPTEFSGYTGDDRAAADAAMKLQRLEFDRRASALATEREILTKQISEASEQITGYGQQVTASVEEQRLIKQEIDGLQPLLAQGLVPMTRMRSLQRNQAELRGGQGEYSADIARTQQEVGEKRIRIQDLIVQRDADDSKDYRAAEIQLADLEPKLTALREQIALTQVRAPVAGQVLGLTAFTVGGVITPGQKIMDIVPENETLVVQAKVKPGDAEDLKIGQSTQIRIPSFHDRGLPILHGVVSKVAADALTDEKTGRTFFTIEVSVPAGEVAEIRKVRGADAGLKPGLPIEVIVPLRKRTALDYLVDPFKQMVWRSFREK